MSEFIQFVFALLVTFSIIVTVHELGHYMAARFFGVHVLRFSLGFGTPFFSKSFPRLSLLCPRHTMNPSFPQQNLFYPQFHWVVTSNFLMTENKRCPSEFLGACFNHKDLGSESQSQRQDLSPISF